nr:TonB-dependent receptor [Pseudoxanthomonas sp.]
MNLFADDPRTQPTPSPLSRKKAAVLSCAVASILALGAAPARAQQADDTTVASEGTEVKELGRVITKGTREIKDVTGGALGVVSRLNTPFSISAVPFEALQDKQPASLYEAFASDASVTRQAGSAYTGWSSFISVRGIPISSTDGSQKINGVPVTTWGLSLPIEVMDQIQLLKGASGFMYGFTSPGGAVNYVTKKPVEGSQLSAGIGWTSDNILKGHVDIGRGAEDGSGVGYRINAVHEDGTTSTGTGVKRSAFSLALQAGISESLKLSFDTIYLKSEFTKPAPMVFLTSYNQSDLPSPKGVNRNAQASEAFDNPSFLYVGAALNWQLAPSWDADLRFTHSKTEQAYSKGYLTLLDASGRYQDRTFESLQIYNNDAVQLLVNGDADVFGVNHKLALGATLIKQRETRGLSHQLPGYRNYGYRNLYTKTDFSYTPIAVEDQSRFPNNWNRQQALFVSDTIQLTPHWLAIAGVRFTRYEQSQTQYAFASATSYTRNTLNIRTNETTPTLAVMFKPRAETTVYASYSEALEPGSTVGAQYVNYGQLLDPNTSKQWEVGFKNDSRTVRSAISAFRVDRGTAYANENNVWVQSGISRYQGLDGSLDLRLGEDLQVGGSFVWLDKADYLNSSSAWLIEKNVPGSYRYSGSLHADYSVPAVEGLSFSAQARYTGETVAYQNTARLLTIKTPSYTLYDVSAKYQQLVGGHAVTYRAGINNLFDKTYWIGGSATYMFLGDPRTYFASVTFDF